jgi:hypothetical protein
VHAPPHRGGWTGGWREAGGRAGGGSRRRSCRRRHRRRHRDCSRGDCYLPTGTNTQQPPPPPPPREPLPELPARTPGDRSDRPGPGPAGECGMRRGPHSGLGDREVHPKRPGWHARGSRLRTRVPHARLSLGGALATPPSSFRHTRGGGDRRLTFYKTSWGVSVRGPLSMLTLTLSELGAPRSTSQTLQTPWSGAPREPLLTFIPRWGLPKTPLFLLL